MKPVYQTRFGGSAEPEADQGDCMQAALASVFEVALEDAPDFTGEINNGRWYVHFDEWLAGRNLELVVMTAGAPPVLAHYLQCVKSVTLPDGDGHVVVALNGEVVHDPNPRATSVGEFEESWLFVARDPARQPNEEIA